MVAASTRLLSAIVLSAAWAAFTSPSAAQSSPSVAASFPSQTITIVVGYPPGGSTDLTGRAVAQELGAKLGVPVVIENIGGAGGTIGLNALMEAETAARPISASPFQAKKIALGMVTSSCSRRASAGPRFAGSCPPGIPSVVLDVPKSRPQLAMSVPDVMGIRSWALERGEHADRGAEVKSVTLTSVRPLGSMHATISQARMQQNRMGERP